MNFEDKIQKAVNEISSNHLKIIDDWCKAYMAQRYKEGKSIEPGSFTLCEQVPTFHVGENCMVKKYWLEDGKPRYPSYDGWIEIEDRIPPESEEILMTYNNLVMSGWFKEGKFYYITQDTCQIEEQEGITHWMPLPLPPEE